MDESMALVRALYKEHGGALLCYLRRLTRNSETAEDLLQDTFVQAMRGHDQLRRVRSARAWLFSIARHLGLNALRRRRIAVSLSENTAAAAVQEDDPRLERMRRAIMELPESQRETLQLRLHNELAYEEIAEVLGIPIGTVRSRLHNAVKNLRERLPLNEE